MLQHLPPWVVTRVAYKQWRGCPVPCWPQHSPHLQRVHTRPSREEDGVSKMPPDAQSQAAQSGRRRTGVGRGAHPRPVAFRHTRKTAQAAFRRPWRPPPVPTTHQGGATELHAPGHGGPDPRIGGKGKPPPRARAKPCGLARASSPGPRGQTPAQPPP